MWRSANICMLNIIRCTSRHSAKNVPCRDFHVQYVLKFEVSMFHSLGKSFLNALKISEVPELDLYTFRLTFLLMALIIGTAVCTV